MRASGGWWWFLGGLASLLAGASLTAVGCSSYGEAETRQDTEVPSSTPAEGEFDASEPEPTPTPPEEADAGGEDAALEAAADAAVEAAASPCDGRPNGYVIDGGAPANRCCGQQAVDLRTADNCGGCGIKCPAGSACEQPVPGQWGCRCVTDLSCVGAGYGASATCYDNGGAKLFCNCQCPGNATTCAGACGGGATCHDVPGQNYCDYPSAL